MIERIKQIMSDVFKIPLEQIGDDAAPDTLKGWDSANHFNLVLSLEDEFEIQFTDNEILEMISLELIILTLKEKGAA